MRYFCASDYRLVTPKNTLLSPLCLSSQELGAADVSVEEEGLLPVHSQGWMVRANTEVRDTGNPKWQIILILILIGLGIL